MCHTVRPPHSLHTNGHFNTSSTPWTNEFNSVAAFPSTIPSISAPPSSTSISSDRLGSVIPSSDVASVANDVINSLNRAAADDPRMMESELYQFMNSIRKGEMDIEGNRVIEGNSATHMTGMSEAWDHVGSVASGTIASDSAFEAAWMNALNEATDGSFETAENDMMFENAWKEALEEAKRNFDLNEGRVETHQYESAWSGLDSVSNTEYEYATDNPLLPMHDAFEKGMHYFKEGALALAVLAFEAEVQRDPSNSEAWRMLGKTFC
jgi:hypothetical protein